MYVSSLRERPNLAFKKTPITPGDFGKFVELKIDSSSIKQPRLTVAVVAFNEREQLTNLIDSLLASQKSSAESFEVLLVDNGLDADVAYSLKQLPIHYVKTVENFGCSQGRNIASAFAGGELIAFLDADAEVETDYIDQALLAMADPNTICARGRVRPLTPDRRFPTLTTSVMRC